MSFPRYPKYKESGVEWLGEVPEEWSVTPVKHLGRLKGGTGFPHEKQGVQGDELSFHKVNALAQADQSGVLRPSENTISREIARELGAFVFPPQTIVFAKVGAALLLGRVRMLQHDACIDNNMIGLIVRNGSYYVDFVRYAMSLVRFDLISNPGTVPSLNEGQIGNVQLPMPAMAEQICIAEFLDREIAKIDELVEEQRRLIELLKEKRQAVISHAVTKGLNPHAPMKPSGIEWLGKIPEHWEVWKFAHFAPIITCGVAATPEYVEDGIAFLSAQNVKANKVVFENHKFISEETHRELTKNRAPVRGDVLLSRVGTIGEAAVVETDRPFSIFVSLTHIRCDPSTCLNYYLVGIFESAYFKTYSRVATAYGGGVGNLNVHDLREFKIPLPPIEEQQRILDYIGTEAERLDALTAEAQRAIDLLQERRTALISAAVTGQIDVRHLAENEMAV